MMPCKPAEEIYNEWKASLESKAGKGVEEADILLCRVNQIPKYLFVNLILKAQVDVLHNWVESERHKGL